MTRATLPQRRPKSITVRPIRIEGDVAHVPLTRGYEAVIDAADASLVSKWNWYAKVANHTIYAMRREYVSGAKSRTIYMHRIILQPSEVLDCDHIDGCGLNNRRANLREATRSQNMCNRRTRRSPDRLKGTAWHRQKAKWLSRIRIGGRVICLGYYATEDLAHAAYVAASAKYHGEFGRLA